MILIDKDVFFIETEEVKSTLDFKSWWLDLYNGCAGYENFTKVAIIYAKKVLGRDVRKTYPSLYDKHFGRMSPAAYKSFEEVYSILVNII